MELGVGAGLVARMNSQWGKCIPDPESLREAAGSSCLHPLWEVVISAFTFHLGANCR